MVQVIIEKNRLTTPLLIALAVLKGIDQIREGKLVGIYDLTSHLVTLKNKGMDIGAISLEFHLEGKLYSREIDGFLTEEEVFGNLSHYRRDDVGLNERTELACLKLIQEYFNEDVQMTRLIAQASESLGMEF